MNRFTLAIIAILIATTAAVTRLYFQACEENKRLSASIELLQSARSADAAASLSAQKEHAAAAARARNAKDELDKINEISAQLSDRSFVDRLCSLLPSSCTGTGIAASKSDAGMPGADTADQPGGGR